MHAISVEERRARLARRHRLAPGSRAGDVVEAARSLVCLHATTPSSVYLSAWARVDGFTVAAMDKALYSDRDLVKHIAMRRTLFAFPTDALGAVQAGASAKVGEAESRRLVREVEQAGLHRDGTAWLAKAGQAVIDALADGRELTSTELREEIPLLSGSITYGAGKSWGGQFPVGPRVLTILSARGQVVRASNDGPWTSSRPRWAAMRSWTGRSVPEVDRSAGVATLVRWWLAAFGPGTLEDIKWWLGGTVAATRRALVDVGAVEVALGEKTGFVLPDDVGPTAPVDPWAALLPELDPATMGWFDRDWYLRGHRHQLFDSNGNGGNTAWWDGRIVGGWHQSPAGEVVVDLLEDVGREARRALEVEAGRLTDWLGGIRVTGRYPSPLSKRVPGGGPVAGT
ncbi:MAG TPA: winged helix DNA-binding domain-containing protein [Nocardioidaceae bacterium]|nr:winged helix DNA-binding domain-containing protein [Nocardioidaceae bacterium]